MKGIAPIIIVAVVAGLVITGIVLSGLVIDTHTIRRTAREVTVIDAINTVEFAKRALEQSAVYSFYQSSYEVSKRGGYTDLTKVKTVDAIPLWRSYGDTTGFPTNYGEDIRGETLRITNMYVAALKTEKLSLPSYVKAGTTSITGDEISGALVKLRLFATDKISFVQKNFVTVTDVADVSREFSSSVFKMFDYAQSKFISADGVRQRIEQAESDTIEKDWRSISFGTVCENRLPDCESELKSKYGDVDKKFSDSISTKFIPSAETQIKIEFEIGKDGIKTSHTALRSSTKTNTDCDCKSPRIVTKTVPCEFDSSQSCVKEETVCDEYYKSFQDVKCAYNYYGAVKAKIKMTDTSRQYPVYDGKENKIQDLVLNFAVLSCNFYSADVCGLG